jgi:serine/threonine protein kinase
MAHGDLRAVCRKYFNELHTNLSGFQANILINDSKQACLADFGLTRVATTATITASTAQHTNARWTSPELLKEEIDEPDAPSDIYAFGFVCIEVG